MSSRQLRMVIMVFCNQMNVIGVRYLASYLKSKAIDIQIIYMISAADSFNNVFSDKLYGEIIEFCGGADLIGVSLTSNFFPEARNLSDKLKQHLEIPIVFGGVHPTIEVEECLEFADYVIMGEGEEPSYELITTLAAKRDVSLISNLAFKKDSMIIKNKLRPLYDLDDLPIPDLDFTTHYLVDDNELKKITVDLMKKHMLTHSNIKRVTYAISTTRGCPHSCTYCVNYFYKQIFGAKGYVRKRSLENIMEELKLLIKKYPFIEYIFLADETFFVQEIGLIRKFSEQYNLEIGLPLKIEFSPHTFDEDKLLLMLKAGAVELHLGVESGSDKTNYEIYHRKFPITKIKTILNVIDKYRNSIEVAHIHILICNPFETLDNTKETFRFVVDVPNSFHIRFFPLVFFPGTKLLEMANELGLINDKENDVYLKTWDTRSALKQADYYTLCMIFLYRLKQKFKIGTSVSLFFYSFMAFPGIRSILGSSIGKGVLVWSYTFLPKILSRFK